MKIAAIALAVSALLTSAAGATTFLNSTTPTGELGKSTAIGYLFSASPTSGIVTFELAGYRTLDGVNCCTDTVNVSLNGTSLLVASYNLGGGGTNTVFSGSPTVTYYVSGSPAAYNGTANGGLIDITLAANFAAGNNLLTFAYTGADQGLGDEAWGINRAFAGTVPEPASWALLVAGFGLVGASLRQRSARAAIA